MATSSMWLQDLKEWIHAPSATSHFADVAPVTSEGYEQVIQQGCSRPYAAHVFLIPHEPVKSRVSRDESCISVRFTQPSISCILLLSYQSIPHQQTTLASPSSHNSQKESLSTYQRNNQVSYTTMAFPRPKPNTVSTSTPLRSAIANPSRWRHSLWYVLSYGPQSTTSFLPPSELIADLDRNESTLLSIFEKCLPSSTALKRH
jgi:hypothetical protein